MTLKKYLIITAFCLLYLNIYSQDNIPKVDEIVFKDGTIKQGKLKVNNSRGIEFNGKVKLCQGKKYKDCIAYNISEINKITQAPPELIVNQLKELNRNKTSNAYKKLIENSTNLDEFKIETYINYFTVVYNKDEKNGGLARLIYSGKNNDFYNYSKTGKNGGKTVLTKPNSNSIIFSFNSTPTSNKFSLKQLTEYFKNCYIFTKESTVKNAHKKHTMKYFFKLTDNCNEF